MQIDFWKKRWNNNEIGFHEKEPNPLLVKHINALGLLSGQTIFVPLCGKSVDLAWLLSQGFRVIGSELVNFAVEQLFIEAGIEFAVDKRERKNCYFAQDGTLPLHVYGGNIFDLSAEDLGTIDAIYDRGALIALPIDIRRAYVRHLMNISPNAKQLLITLNYDQSEMVGPPFSISQDDLVAYYGEDYSIVQLESSLIFGGLRGVENITENVWLLEVARI